MSDYERLYRLDVLGVEDRAENYQLDVYAEFEENVSRKPDGRYEVNSINDCMHKGPSLQSLLWDILLRARMSPNLLIGDIEKAL